MSRSLVVCALVVTFLGAGSALAQTPASGPTLVYGIAAGPAHRDVRGSFAASKLPTGAVQPEADRTVTSFGLQAGVKLNRHVALLGIWDQTFGGNTGRARWGTSDVHAVGRVWVGRLWVQAGGGLSQLGYKAATGPGIGVERFWAPGIDGCIGADVLQGRRVSLVVAARATRATFEGLTITRVGMQVGLFGRR